MRTLSIDTKAITSYIYSKDTDAEHELIRKAALEAGAFDAVISRGWNYGGSGVVDAAEAVIRAAESPKNFKFLYNPKAPLVEKIATISSQMYGAGEVELSAKAQEAVDFLTAKGYGDLPICMSKTSASLTGDPNIKGAPKGFKFYVNDVYLSAGAGFVVVMCGAISKMPGLPTRPCIYDIDLNTETGEIEGLF